MWNILKKVRKTRSSSLDPGELFKKKYALFQELLSSNAENLDLIADMEDKLKGETLFGMSYVRAQSARAVFHSHRMVRALEGLSGGGYPGLLPVLEELSGKIRKELKDSTKEVEARELVLPYDRIHRGVLDLVGGKNANLGEVKNKVGLPVPEGFAITTAGFHLFMESNDLKEEVSKLQMEINPDDPQSLANMSEEIQRRILLAHIPKELEEAILGAYERSFGHGEVTISMRSSATSEDTGGLSFAGQYLSSLNVPPGQILQTYKIILGSLYTSRAIAYRLHKGIRDEDQAMAVACLRMVEAKASGVMYSRNPSHPEDGRIWISAVWGLGPYAVGGVITPDTFRVERTADPCGIEIQVSHKPVMLLCRPEGGLQEVPVEDSLMDAPCLEIGQIRELARYLVLLEEHFGGPQDVEWALDPEGNILILQCRPLASALAPGTKPSPSTPAVKDHDLILEGGASASPGVGFGPAFHVHTEEDLLRFPNGAVLVAARPSPKFMVALPKAKAVITDYGSVTGHMASLAREFSVPAILDLKEATSRIPDGMLVTVDADNRRIYKGKVDELLEKNQAGKPLMLGTPVHQTLKRVARWITPLRLVDPGSADFRPEKCASLHDIMRFVHEMSYYEMFKISDLVSQGEGGAVRLKAPLPIDLHLIDLGGGLKDVGRKDREVSLEQLQSAPLRALLKGMTHSGLLSRDPRPIEWRGFLSVMTEQMLSNPLASERFGERSFAIVSDKYMNFSSRVGYHYGVLDTYCGRTLSKNYITFSFQGGAADELRRNRRARAIARILERLGFSVEVIGDRTTARMQKRDQSELEEKLDQVGRLLVFTRQMDMLMQNEEAVEIVVEAFLREDYACRGLLGWQESTGGAS